MMWLTSPNRVALSVVKIRMAHRGHVARHAHGFGSRGVTAPQAASLSTALDTSSSGTRARVGSAQSMMPDRQGTS